MKFVDDREWAAMARAAVALFVFFLLVAGGVGATVGILIWSTTH